MTRTRLLIVGAALMLGGGAAGGSSPGWPQWRGPDRNGILAAAAAPAEWPEKLNKGWTVSVGEGYSSPVAGGGLVFVHSRRDPDEVVMALNPGDGAVAWQQTYHAPVTKNPYAKAMAKGPYSTPLFADGRLYTLGTTAILSAWNAKTGALLWRKDFSKQVDTSKLFCGTAMSPLRIQEGIIVQVGDDRAGSLTAFDPATGKEVWKTAMRGPGYASPIEITLHGTRQIVTMTTGSVVGVAARDGSVLWEFPFDDEWNENIVTPIATPTGVIVSGVRQGTRALTVTRSGTGWAAKQAWHTPDVAMYMSTPVLVNGVLFGHSAKRKGQLVAVDASDGRMLWSTEGRAGTSASVVAAGTRLLFLTTESELLVAELDPAAYRELRRYTVASTPTYAHLVLLGPDLVVRDATNVTRWSVR